MIEAVKIPEISENVTSGKVVKVLVAVGDTIAADDILIELETEKALVEIPSTVSGEIVELAAREGMEMQVGDVIAKIDVSDPKDGAAEAKAPQKEAPGKRASESESSDDLKNDSESKDDKEDNNTEARGAIDAEGQKPPTKRMDTSQPPDKKEESESADQAAETSPAPAPAAPSVRRFARELGVDIRRIGGTGPGGRITPDDVTAAVRRLMSAGPAPDHAEMPQSGSLFPDFSRWGDTAHEEMDGVRRIIARNTALSWQTVPHVTQFDRADIRHVQHFLDTMAPKMKRQGIRLTVTAVVMKVCALALRRFPRFNASIDPDRNRIVLKKYIHIGLAVDTERGLLVPVVRDADQKGIQQLAGDIHTLAERARTKKIRPDEMEGGTFTISNQGGIGGTQFTPVVLWPQAAILGLSRITLEPVFNEGNFEPRPMLPMALSYDHRLIDGADAARFLGWIRQSLEQPLNLQLE